MEALAHPLQLWMPPWWSQSQLLAGEETIAPVSAHHPPPVLCTDRQRKMSIALYLNGRTLVSFVQVPAYRSLCLLVLPPCHSVLSPQPLHLLITPSPLGLYPSFIPAECGLLEQTKWLCKYEFQILQALTYGGSFFEPRSALGVLSASCSTTSDLGHHSWVPAKSCYRISIFII